MLADTSDKPGLQERYSTAVSSSNLKVNPRTRMSDTDVLGAMGLTDRELTEGKDSQGEPVRPAPLAVALERLLVGGDNRAAHEIVRTLADMAWRRARADGVKLGRAQAKYMARAVLAWHRNGVCRPCGGLGHTLIPGTRTLSDALCQHCAGLGKIPLDRQFEGGAIGLARWLSSEIDREAGRAGPRAMQKLAGDMDLR